MEKFEVLTMKKFIDLLGKGERVYFDDENNLFGCGVWLCRGVNQIPFTTVGAVYHFNADTIIKECEYTETKYLYTDSVGALYERVSDNLQVTADPKLIGLFKDCEICVHCKDMLTVWWRGNLVGVIMGIKRRTNNEN